MTKFTYLLVNLGTILIPFLFSFHPKLKFYKTWKSFFPAVAITGLIFVVWDIYFTCLGVWGFNNKYLTGSEVLNLPVEEILFFFCIPYACVFTYHCLDLLLKQTSESAEPILTTLIIIFLVITGIFCYNKLYTAFTFLSLAIVLVLARYILRVTWLARFYLVYSILLIPFLIVNGILTGSGLEQPVVWYNEMEILGIRIATIPMEDIFYGMELVLVNLLFYKEVSNRRSKTT